MVIVVLTTYSGTLRFVIFNSDWYWTFKFFTKSHNLTELALSENALSLYFK